MSAFSNDIDIVAEKFDGIDVDANADAEELDVDKTLVKQEIDDDDDDDVDDTEDDQDVNDKDAATEPAPSIRSKSKVNAVKYGTAPIYCAICTCPPEFCEYGPTYDKCLPWILENFPEVLSEEVLAKALGKTNDDVSDDKETGGEEKKKKKRGGASVPKKVAVVETKVYISRVQRQKRKFVTTIVGLDTVPDLKLKDAARVFGRKFSSGTSIGDTATGAKEIVIQGDVSFELPPLLVSEFKISKSAIFLVDESGTRPYEG